MNNKPRGIQTIQKQIVDKLIGYSLITIILIGFSSVNVQVFGQTFDYAKLLENVQEEQWSLSYNGNDEWVNTQNLDGSWSEFTYGQLSTSIATSDNHIFRIWNLTSACTKAGSAKYNNESYKNAIKIGLEYWYNSGTVDPNWWFNKIYFPQKIGQVLILLREFPGFIPESPSAGIDETELISLFSPTAINDISSHGTGANATDIAMHYVYRGILLKDDNLLEGIRDHLSPIVGINIESDHCYHDHGPQLQVGSYGWVYCNGLIKLAGYLSDSPAEFDTQSGNFATVLDFIRDVQIPAVRGNHWDFSAVGRGVSRKGATSAGMAYLNQLASDIDVSNASYYMDAIGRMNGSKPATYEAPHFNRHYWESDYTQHSRMNYLYTVRNVSTRTAESETGNGESLKANYFSYGANFIAVDGDEYYNIMPIWDWSMIPGITFLHTTTFPSRATWGNNFGSTDFVGGVSDGIYGASVLNMYKEGVKAKKSWFMFDDEIMCLGSGISAAATGMNLRTTINQCWLEGQAYFTTTDNTSEQSVSVSSQEYNETNLKWIRHGNAAYFFPENTDVKFTLRSQSGSWYDINTLQSSGTESGYVFKLWIDHGDIPDVNPGYSYVIVPNTRTLSETQNYNLNNIEIISNTENIQAVYQKNLDIYQLVFHEGGYLSDGNLKITVDKPCVVMLKDGKELSVADPTQTEGIVDFRVVINGTVYAGGLNLPSGNGMEGSTVTANLEDYFTEIEKYGLMDEFTIYPNPTHDLVKITMDSNESLIFEIKDIQGRTLKKEQFVNNAQIDISELPGGIYFATVRDNYRIIGTKKLVKF